MELLPPKLEFRHLLVGNLEALFVEIGVDLAFHGQAGRRCGCGDEVDDDLVADEWLTAPVLADEREQTVLDLVPFAGAWREMTDTDFQSGFVCQLLQFPFPEPHARPITAAGVGSDQQTLRFRITAATHPAPPAAYALDGELRRVVIHSHTDPPRVPSQVVDSIGGHLAVFRLTDFEIMHPNLPRLSLRMPFTPRIPEIAHRFLLFRVYRNHRFALLQMALGLAVDVFKLPIPIRMLAPFQLLLVGLQTVIASPPVALPQNRPACGHFLTGDDSRARSRISESRWRHGGALVSSDGGSQHHRSALIASSFGTSASHGRTVGFVIILRISVWRAGPERET